MIRSDLPHLETDPDPLRRGLRAVCRHAHWIVAGSALFSIGLLLGLQTAGGSVAQAATVAALLTIPGGALLTVVSQRIVVEADCDWRALRSVPGRGWLRSLHVPVVATVLTTIGAGALIAYPLMPPVLAWPALTVVGASLLAYVLLAPLVATLALQRPAAPLVRVWLVAFLATSARPVAVLGGLVAVLLLSVATWHVQILLFFAPGVAAIVLSAAAWTALAAVGIEPGRTPAPTNEESRGPTGEVRSLY